MSKFTWFSGRGPALTQAQLERRGNLAAPRTHDERPLQQQRFVVLDLETSGLNMRRDQVLSIGAVVIDNGAIDLSQQFECTLLREGHQASASTLIHGIAPSEIANGEDPAQALLTFMEFVGNSPLLAFHAGFDQGMLARALKQTLDYRLQHRFFDVAELAPMLCPQADIRHGGLDDWTRYFGLQVHQRHHASADALATAELALILFSKARSQQLDSLHALEQQLTGYRRRQHAHSL
ncbi:3'-5' exonuclease [Pseudomonas sp. HMWF032]|uniref:3'-5' exonuclease n=1 Tax=unclassified Pseudomonas TaxID=196821 RepID=UPI000D3B0C55|nr:MULTISPECIES: 3'-5' exonuclease [unclassified Pseudomonas]PTS83399.1 3'-5' exonuclease [Pseudomonas sp. HMWF032]PTT76757.1 3'-5' exonuclease [Pseudomonas sp. HMWF010]WAC45683.1 3'-5' exonuclease [Pseudomonas sp. SL4(2022)]